MLNFYDFEVFKYDWLVVIINPVTGEYTEIVNDPILLNAYYQEHKEQIWVGYNSNNYDQYILKGIQLGFNPKKIILVDSAGIRPKKKKTRIIKEKIFKCIKAFANIIFGKEKAKKIIDKYKNKMGSEDYKNANETMKEVFKNVINEDLTQYLPNIKSPTLLIWGDKDMETPIEDGRKMESLIPDSGLVVINGAGHFSYLENCGYFLVVVKKFLEGCE